MHVAALAQPQLRRAARPRPHRAQATAELRTTTEGVKSCESILTLAGQHGVDLPIVEQVVAVIRDGHPAREVGPG